MKKQKMKMEKLWMYRLYVADGDEAIVRRTDQMDRRKRKKTKGHGDGKFLPVAAWEKLKGRGPFPYTVPDERTRKWMADGSKTVHLRATEA